MRPEIKPMKTAAETALAEAFAAVRAKLPGDRRITFVDGAFVAELSDLVALEPGLSIAPMAKALAESDPLVASRLGAIVPTDDVAVALNTAFMGDGALVHIDRDARLERPIHLVFAFGSDTASARFTRSLVVAEEGAQSPLIESHAGPDGIDYQVNTALELFVGDRAHVDHVKIGIEGARAIHVSTLMASIGAHARLRDLVFTTRGALVRNQLFVRFAGEGATLALNGANLITGRQHVDNTLAVDYAVPGGFSRELNKSVLDGES